MSGRELGRISGPLLANNLKRNGSNLAFETKLLYLNVNSAYIGVNTNAPSYTVDVNGTTRTTNLNVATQANLANLEFYTNTIQNVVGNITINPNQASNPTIIVPVIQASNVLFSGNTVSDIAGNNNLNISLLSGYTTAQIQLNANTTVTGNLHATGDITWDGNITLGSNTSVDTVTFDAKINSNILPSSDNVNTLGSSSLTWANVYSNTVTVTTTTATNLTTGLLTSSGTTNLNNNVTIGTTSVNTLAVTSKIDTPLIPNTTNTYNIGSITKYWNNICAVTFDDGNITATVDTLQTNTSNSNLQLKANGSGQVVLSALNVTNNVTVGTSLAVSGATSLANTTTGTVVLVGAYNQIGNVVTTGSISSGSITATNPLTLPGITINNSTITGTVSNNLILTAKVNQQVEVTSNAVVDQNLNVNGTITVLADSLLANTSTNDITLVGNYNQVSGNFSTTGTVRSYSITATDPLTLPNLSLSGSTITGNNSNTNLILTANAGQAVEITSATQFASDVAINGTLTLLGTPNLKNTIVSDVSHVGDLNQTGIFSTSGNFSANNLVFSGTADTFNVDDFVIGGNTITVSPTNGSATFLSDGGNVWLGNDIKVFNNNIINNFGSSSSTIYSENGQIFVSETGQVFITDISGITALQDSLLLTPQVGGYVIANSVNSLILPSGHDPAYLLPANGYMRFNNTNYNVEGYENTGYVNFFNIYSQDYKTYITPELLPGNADNTIRFGIGSSVTTTITSSALTNNSIYAGNIKLYGNTISNLVTSNNISFLVSGNGKVNFNSFQTISDNIVNLPNTGALTIASTAAGHTKFSGSNGTVLPVGTNNDHPANPEVGTVRYNSQTTAGEVYNGAAWVNIDGPNPPLTGTEVTDTMWVWDIILG